MKVYHILLALVALAAITAVTNRPSAQANEPAIATVPVTQQAWSHIEGTTEALRDFLPVAEAAPAGDEAYPLTNTVSLIGTAFERISSREGTATRNEVAALPFNQGMLLLGEKGYLSGHHTLMILHANAALPLEQRLTGFLIQPSGQVIPSRVSIHSNRAKLEKARKLYGNTPY